MNYDIIPTSKFKKEAKRLLKKYPSLKGELAELNKSLKQNPTLGTSLGFNAYTSIDNNDVIKKALKTLINKLTADNVI